MFMAKNYPFLHLLRACLDHPVRREKQVMLGKW